MTPSGWRQFRRLYRDFMFRILDLEVLSAGGDVGNLLAQFASLLAAFSFTIAVFRVPQYAISTLPRDRLLVLAWGDETFLISTTMAVTGMFTVLAWNALLPDRRDYFVLGCLPVRGRTILLAKVAAIVTALVVSIGSINVFTGLAYPFLLADGFLGGLRTLGAWWLAMILAGLFPFCFLLALQGIAAWLLSYRLFLNACTVLQMVSFFGILGLFFLGPPLASPAGLVAPSNQRLLAIVPWFWFLGLFQELNGPLHPAFQALAARALGFLTGMAALAILAYATNWMRLSRQILELPDIAPADRGGPPGRIIRLLATRLLSRPLDRAVVLFTARTIARSRQHRLLLAAYAGIALAIALAYVRSLLYGESREPWNTVNVPLLVGGFVLLFFIVFGTRAAFALPIALRSNWIFRVTAVHCPSSYFAAARRALFALSVVPVCVACVIVYSIIWPFPAVLQHMLVLTLFGVLLVECSMNRFHKIPFTCSYLPGKSNLRVRLGAYAIAFLFLADLGVRIEYWAIASRSRYAVMVAVLFAAAVLASRRRVRSQDIRIQFEELTAPDVLTLELRGDRS